MIIEGTRNSFMDQIVAMGGIPEPVRDKIEIDRISVADEVWYRIPSGFKDMMIHVEESASEGVSVKLVRKDGIASVAGE